MIPVALLAAILALGPVAAEAVFVRGGAGCEVGFHGAGYGARGVGRHGVRPGPENATRVVLKLTNLSYALVVLRLRLGRELFVTNFESRSVNSNSGRETMKFVIALLAALTLSAGAAQAQVELKTYADANGDIDVQKLTCAQLAGTFQEDADAMTLWYSGWYNGLANAGRINLTLVKELEHRVIVYCKENQDKRVISAIDVIFKGYRKERGIKLEGEK